MPILIFIILLAANGELPPASNPGEYPAYVAEDNDQSQPLVAPVTPPTEWCGARCEARGGIEARNERRANRQARRAARQACNNP